MATLFDKDDSESESDLKVNKDYATNYNSWRQKEELNKLKTKYGEHIKNLESSEEDSEPSSDEDEDGAELTEEVEKSFFKTLACLKNKDPKIYDEKVKFFEETCKNSEAGSSKKLQKEKKLFLRDYEREMVIERGGKLSDSEDEDIIRDKKRESRKQTYVEEQRALKESISKVVADDSDNEDDNFLVPKTKSESEKLTEEEAYKEWLKGQQTEVENEEKNALKPLRDFWTDPNLDPKEKFLRDYILNKKFLDNDDEDRGNLDYDQVAHDSDENLSEDERNIEKQEEFEHKYNFRFEEPDQEFIKRYPRTLENSLRKKDTRRAQKRAEVKQRKEEEKIRKQEELKQLKALKRKEIAEKIAQLKDITGNDDIQFENFDLEGDFDPEEHDRKMREIFNEDYYSVPEEGAKPEFPDIDEELDVEKPWDDYDPENEEIEENSREDGNPHCEDPEFNMDADYDPAKTLQDELIDSTKKKKRRRRSKFAELIAKEKPKFDPKLHLSFRDYIEQYYALDYEDMIDDLPCRFKYRKVVPNDYGLTVEEILMADDQELNKWCSLKKALEHKPENVEMNEVRIYQQKAKNEGYKRKILKSLYTPEEEPQDPETAITPLNRDDDESTNKKKRKKKKKKKPSEMNGIANEEKAEKNNPTKENSASEASATKKRKRKNSDVMKDANSNNAEVSRANQFTNDETSEKNIPAKENSVSEKKKKETNAVPEAFAKKNKKKKISDVTEDSNSNNANVIASKKKSKKNIPSVEKSASGETKKDTNTTAEASVTKTKKRKISEVQEGSNSNNAEAGKNIAKKAKFENANSVEKEKKQKRKEKKKHSANMPNKKFKKTVDKSIEQIANLSSMRLKAYGLNPKKFKNKLKYGNR